MAKDAAAKDLKVKKRKASTTERDAEKPKKVKSVLPNISEAPAKKRKATDDVAPAKTKKSKTPIEDLLSEQVKKAKPAKPVANGTIYSKSAREATSLDKPIQKKDKKVAKASDKTVKEASNGASAPSAFNADKSSTKTQKATNTKDSTKAEAKQTEDKAEETDDDSENEVDDQTEALLKGFESDGDEEETDPAKDYKKGDAIPSITENETVSKKQQRKLAKAAEFPGQHKPGVVFVSRVPHGFYENEMKAYFGQFGTIVKLRLSRNKRTGASKHYAFIQFEDASVASIVAKTMDNYLMFGHLLKVKLIPEEQVPANVWKGANKRFKKVPWNKLEGRKLEQGASEETWNNRIEKEQERRDKKAKEMKAIGYEFEAPAIKSAKGLSKKTKLVPELTENDEEAKAIEAVPVVEDEKENLEGALATEESSKPNKKKKSKAGKAGEGSAVVEEPKSSEKEVTSIDAKLSKEDIEESVASLITETTEKPGKKEKKDKKKKKSVELAGAPDEEVKPEPTKLEPASEYSKPKKDKKKKSKVVAE